MLEVEPAPFPSPSVAPLPRGAPGDEAGGGGGGADRFDLSRGYHHAAFAHGGGWGRAW